MWAVFTTDAREDGRGCRRRCSGAEQSECSPVSDEEISSKRARHFDPGMFQPAA